jgi:hypothetical protein
MRQLPIGGGLLPARTYRSPPSSPTPLTLPWTAQLHAFAYRSSAEHGTTLIFAPANISLLNDDFARSIVPLIAVG